jgi:hypothetical protein
MVFLVDKSGTGVSLLQVLQFPLPIQTPIAIEAATPRKHQYLDTQLSSTTFQRQDFDIHIFM